MASIQSANLNLSVKNDCFSIGCSGCWGTGGSERSSGIQPDGLVNQRNEFRKVDRVTEVGVDSVRSAALATLSYYLTQV